MLVRDEADVIGHTVEHLWTQVDGIIVLDNGSVDGTREILEAANVAVHDDPDPAHYQGAKTTWLAQRARELGYDWVVPVDADEIWYAPRHDRVADALADLDDQAPYDIANAALYDHFATGADDPDEPNPFRRLGWRKRQPSILPKVACRTSAALRVAEGNHGAAYDWPPRVAVDYLVVRHFPYRDAEHFIRKGVRGAAALALTDLPESVGGHWRGYGDLVRRHGKQAGRDWYARYFWYPRPELDPELIFDPAPIRP